MEFLVSRTVCNATTPPARLTFRAQRQAVLREQTIQCRLRNAFQLALEELARPRVKKRIREKSTPEASEAVALTILSRAMNEHFCGRRWIDAGASYHALMGDPRRLTVAVTTTSPPFRFRRIIDLEPKL